MITEMEGKRMLRVRLMRIQNLVIMQVLEMDEELRGIEMQNSNIDELDIRSRNHPELRGREVALMGDDKSKDHDIAFMPCETIQVAERYFDKVKCSLKSFIKNKCLVGKPDRMMNIDSQHIELKNAGDPNTLYIEFMRYHDILGFKIKTLSKSAVQLKGEYPGYYECNGYELDFISSSDKRPAVYGKTLMLCREQAQNTGREGMSDEENAKEMLNAFVDLINAVATKMKETNLTEEHEMREGFDDYCIVEA